MYLDEFEDRIKEIESTKLMMDLYMNSFDDKVSQLKQRIGAGEMKLDLLIANLSQQQEASASSGAK